MSYNVRPTVKNAWGWSVFFFSWLILSSVSIAQGEVKKITDGVWAGEIPAPRTLGVKIYFGIERLDSEQQIESWKTYTGPLMRALF